MSIVPRRRAVASPLAAPRTGVQAKARSARPSLRRRILDRVVEGPHTWGELEVWSSRYGYTTSCLVVYPPGATRSERIRFRAMRSWPPAGMLLGIAAVVIAAHQVPLLAAVLIGAVVYAAGALGLAVLAGPTRHRVRTLQTCRGDEGAAALDRGPQHVLEELSDRLQAAERSWREGRIDAVGFEAVWGRVWHALGDPSLQRH